MIPFSSPKGCDVDNEDAILWLIQQNGTCETNIFNVTREMNPIVPKTDLYKRTHTPKNCFMFHTFNLGTPNTSGQKLRSCARTSTVPCSFHTATTCTTVLGSQSRRSWMMYLDNFDGPLRARFISMTSKRHFLVHCISGINCNHVYIYTVRRKLSLCIKSSKHQIEMYGTSDSIACCVTILCFV